MKTIVKIFAIACFMVSSLATATESTKEDTKESATVAGFKQDMTAFKQEMSVKLDAVESEIVALKEKAKVKGSNVKEATITDLEKTKANIKADLEKLDKSSESAWKKMKTKIANAIDSLNTKTQKAMRD